MGSSDDDDLDHEMREHVARLAAVLVAMGLYFLTPYSVARRPREIELRAALGARSHQIVSVVAGETGPLSIVGAAIGVRLSLIAAGTARSLLLGPESHDPTILVLASVTMAVIAVAASTPPARRTVRVSPMDSIREE